MNSYNDNLRNSTQASLSQQEIVQQQLESQNIANMNGLYYAEGATVMAVEKLYNHEQKLGYYQAARNKVVRCEDVSVNLLNAADKSKAVIGNTVTNTSTAAANVQIANNAIVKLASDIGSIFTIINAADFGGDIYTLGQQAKQKMDQTAYHSEVLSNITMSATSGISNVPIDEIQKVTAKVNADLVQINTDITTIYDAVNDQVKAESADLANAINIEKEAEGEYRISTASCESATHAYVETNDKLNLALTATPKGKVIVVNNASAQYATHQLTVAFDNYESPFPIQIPTPESTSDGGTQLVPQSTSYPFETCTLFVVRKSQAPVFTSDKADALINDGNTGNIKKFVTINPQKHLDKKITIHEKVSIDINLLVYANENVVDKPCVGDISGDPIEMGTEYVVFILGTFDQAYKKMLNDFSDYLSMASPIFNITEQLNSVFIRRHDQEKVVFNASQADARALIKLIDPEAKVPDVIKYRCMFLPILSKTQKTDNPVCLQMYKGQGVATLEIPPSINTPLGKKAEAVLEQFGKYLIELNKQSAPLEKKIESDELRKTEIDAALRLNLDPEKRKKLKDELDKLKESLKNERLELKQVELNSYLPREVQVAVDVFKRNEFPFKEIGEHLEASYLLLDTIPFYNREQWKSMEGKIIGTLNAEIATKLDKELVDFIQDCTEKHTVSCLETLVEKINNAIKENFIDKEKLAVQLEKVGWKDEPKLKGMHNLVISVLESNKMADTIASFKSNDEEKLLSAMKTLNDPDTKNVTQKMKASLLQLIKLIVAEFQIDELISFQSDIDELTEDCRVGINESMLPYVTWENTDSDKEISFIFNETIAASIPFSNYITADKKDGVNEFTVTIQPYTTDIFGNRLAKDMHYIPAIFGMSLPGDKKQYAGKFSDSLTIPRTILPNVK